MPRRMSNNPALYEYDALQRQQHGNICGVDEAGRGPLCGPVCVAAVILNPDDPVEGVNDSKKLSEKRREELYDQIVSRALAYSIVFVSPKEIDEKNILWATMDGMTRAVQDLSL
ncbi:MAG: ribonuclease HII, partial [Gemmiger sp.]